MAVKHCKSAAAVTLIEVAIASVVLVVAVIGGSSYRYYSALDERKATMWRSAARIGLLFSDSWRGLRGFETYDPVQHLETELDVERITGDGPPDGYSLNGTYAVTADDETYYVTLAWQDIDTDTTLKALNIEVEWTPRLAGERDFANSDKSFKLTVYISK